MSSCRPSSSASDNDWLRHEAFVRVDRRTVIDRRHFLRAVGGGAAALSWSQALSLQAAALKQRNRACILLWMQGGPSQFETFDPKPGHENGGPTKAISTSAPGVEISENLPRTAQAMKHICLLRSLTSKEGSHPRATFLMHTGYLPTSSVKHPTLGALVTHQIADREFELPSFVRIGQGRAGGGASAGGGFLGVEFDPFSVASAQRPPDNVQPATTEARFRRRLKLLGRLQDEYASSGGRQEVADHEKLYGKASKMVLSPKTGAFDLSKEPEKVRAAYGDSPFGAGCLLARRLVETGVTFVEVNLGNWDTHLDNFARTKELCGQMDQPYAQLLTDLEDRGLLESTLVVWMGEFGRTPRINPRGGRDHYPRAFCAALAGGGVQGGQAIGRTDAAGASIDDRPIGVADLFRTICHGLKVNADQENMSGIGRPIKVVDGGETVREVFGA